MIELKDINPLLIEVHYAVRGEIVLKAEELAKNGHEIIYCNIGNPQIFKQKPLSYVREVLSLVEYPELINYAKKLSIYKKDSIEKAKYILSQIPEGVGAYTSTSGMYFVRCAVAGFISKRDCIPTNPEYITLTDGASEGAKSIILALIKNPHDGIMVPIPQYPLYNASLMLNNGKSIGYYLDEANNWQLNLDSLESSYKNAINSGINPVAITVINPGNPTGAVLSYTNIEMVINFAKKYNLAIIADEVYQENIYSSQLKFYSFAKVLHDLKIEDVSLFSLHSMSKGYFGECGHRAGYIESRNISDKARAIFVKLQSINLCANAMGQIAMYLMVTPPVNGDASYLQYVQEKTEILNALAIKAHILGSELNKIDGIEVNIPEGAMYAFVRIDLPQKLIESYKGDVALDQHYCLELLKETGVCVVPGSGFGQLPETFHFRTTFLPPVNQIFKFVTQLKEFHSQFIAKYLQ